MSFWKGRLFAHWAHREPGLGEGWGTAQLGQSNREENRREKPSASPTPAQTDPDPSLTLPWTPSDWLWLCRTPGSPAAPCSFQVEDWRWQHSVCIFGGSWGGAVIHQVPQSLPVPLLSSNRFPRFYSLLPIGITFLFLKSSFTMLPSAPDPTSLTASTLLGFHNC